MGDRCQVSEQCPCCGQSLPLGNAVTVAIQDAANGCNPYNVKNPPRTLEEAANIQRRAEEILRQRALTDQPRCL
jgi:hypothetical protein